MFVTIFNSDEHKLFGYEIYLSVFTLKIIMYTSAHEEQSYFLHRTDGNEADLITL